MALFVLGIKVWQEGSAPSLEDAPWRHYLASVGAAHFALRAWSCAYVQRLQFAYDRRRLLDRPWIEAIIRNLGRSDNSPDSSD